MLAPRDRELRSRRGFLKGATLGALTLLGGALPSMLGGRTGRAFARGVARKAPPQGTDTFREIVNRWGAEGLVANLHSGVVHYRPAAGRAGLPGMKDPVPVEKVAPKYRVRVSHRRALLHDLVERHPKSAPLLKAAVLADPLLLPYSFRLIGLYGTRKEYERMLPFLSEHLRALDIRLRTGPENRATVRRAKQRIAALYGRTKRRAELAGKER